MGVGMRSASRAAVAASVLLVAALGSAAPTGATTVAGCTADASNDWFCKFPCTPLDFLNLQVTRTGPLYPYFIAGGADCGLTDASCGSAGGEGCSDEQRLILREHAGTCHGMRYAAAAHCFVTRGPV